MKYIESHWETYWENLKFKQKHNIHIQLWKKNQETTFNGGQH